MCHRLDYFWMLLVLCVLAGLLAGVVGKEDPLKRLGAALEGLEGVGMDESIFFDEEDDVAEEEDGEIGTVGGSGGVLGALGGLGSVEVGVGGEVVGRGGGGEADGEVRSPVFTETTMWRLFGTGVRSGPSGLPGWAADVLAKYAERLYGGFLVEKLRESNPDPVVTTPHASDAFVEWQMRLGWPAGNGSGAGVDAEAVKAVEKALLPTICSAARNYSRDLFWLTSGGQVLDDVLPSCETDAIVSVSVHWAGGGMVFGDLGLGSGDGGGVEVLLPLQATLGMTGPVLVEDRRGPNSPFSMTVFSPILNHHVIALPVTALRRLSPSLAVASFSDRVGEIFSDVFERKARPHKNALAGLSPFAPGEGPQRPLVLFRARVPLPKHTAEADVAAEPSVSEHVPEISMSHFL